MPLDVKYRQDNPFLKPDWRCDRVLQILDVPRPDGKPRRCSKYDDEYIRKYREFLAAYRPADEFERNLLQKKYPDYYYAHLLYENRPDNPVKATTVEARLLAAQDDDEIAEELNTNAAAVNMYSNLFYDVKNRLKARDWILTECLLPSFMADRSIDINSDDPAQRRIPISEPFYDSTLKFYAYFGGKFVLDLMLHAYKSGVKASSVEEVSDWIDNHYMDKIKRRSSAAADSFEVNKYNVMELFSVHNQIIQIQNSIDSDATAQSEIMKNINSMMQSMPWTVGSVGENDDRVSDAVKNSDQWAAELSDEEMMQLSAGESIDNMERVTKLRVPEPRKQEGTGVVEEPENVNNKQGS